MMNHEPRPRNALYAVLFAALLTLAGCETGVKEYEDADSQGAGMNRLAEQLKERGDFVGAAEFYRRAIERDPKNAVAHKGLAGALEMTGRVAEAAEEYRKTIRIKPNDGEAWRNLGRLMLAQENPADARDAYKQALKIDDDDAKAMNGLGVALNNLGDHEEAQKQFQKALREDSGSIATYNNLAYTYILDGKYDEAIKLLEPRIQNPGATPALRQNLALAYGLAGMEADAERVAKIDLPPAKVKENMDYYRRRRAELAISTAPYAEVGTYATQALAEAEIHKIQKQLGDKDADLKPVILPQVTAPGGTPRFTVRMLGCNSPDDLQVLCDKLAKSGLPCLPRTPK